MGLFRAADAALLPYREIFSSAALMLAISHGLPVVAPTGVAEELVQREAVESYEPGRLVQAMVRIREGSAQDRREAALQSAERYGWERVATQTIAVYEEIVLRSGM